ncbi:hypothetical protein QQG55_20105 [Brugia pahangi]
MSEKYAGTTRLWVIAVSDDTFDAIEPLKQLVEDHGTTFQAGFTGEPFNPMNGYDDNDDDDDGDGDDDDDSFKFC